MIIGTGIAATAAAIQRGQQRFDSDAAQVVAAAQDLGGADPSADGAAATAVDAPATSDLTGSLVGLNADAFVNRVLFAVYRKQAEQQSQAADLIRPD